MNKLTLKIIFTANHTSFLTKEKVSAADNGRHTGIIQYNVSFFRLQNTCSFLSLFVKTAATAILTASKAMKGKTHSDSTFKRSMFPLELLYTIMNHAVPNT